MFTGTQRDARTGRRGSPSPRPTAASPATTSTCGMTSSGRRSSRSAPTSPTRPRSGSTATSGPNARPPQAGIGFTELYNGFAATDDPGRAAGDLRPARPDAPSTAFAERWFAVLPLPLTARRPGRRLLVGTLHAPGRGLAHHRVHRAAARPRVLRGPGHRQPRHRPPRTGRADLRPAPGAARPPTPGRRCSSTRVVTHGVEVTVNAYYKHSRIKQYLKDGRALRIGRVAATHCCAAAPSGPCMRVPAHTAQAGPLGCSGRPLLFYGASCCPGGASGPDAGRVYEVCSSVARRAGRAVVG